MDCIQLSLFGKMYPEHSVPTEEKISEPCWKNLPAWNNQTFQFIDLRVGGADGAKLGQFPETGGAWLGDSLMLNTGESPSVESESLLSQILEVNVPQKYYLSAKACQGILIRASRRGKALLDLLKTALLDMIEWWEPGALEATVTMVRGQSETGTGGSSTGEERQDGKTRFEEATQTFAVDCRNGRMEAEISGTLQAKENGGYSLNFQNPIAYTLKIRSGCDGGGKGALVQTEKSATLSTLQDQTLFQPVVYDARGNGDGKIAPTITGDHENRITDYTAIAIERHTFSEQSFSSYKENGKCSTLKAKAGNIGNGSECLAAEKTSVAVDVYNGAVTGDKTATLTCKNDGSSSGPLVAEKTICWIVRRLTPVECERLQGYPDGWTDIGEWVDTKGKKHKPADSPRYKALGNSIALPQWFWIVQKMKPYLRPNATLGSLFDGIGGFPLVWQKTYGNGTARWASEIEEFPIAVTKRRFGEE